MSKSQTSDSLNKVFQISVDYDRSISDGVDAGKYDWSEPNITDLHFMFNQHKGVQNTGIKKMNCVLVHVAKDTHVGNGAQTLVGVNRRPANIRELLAFGEQYPDQQMKCTIIAPAQEWRDDNAYHHFPYLCSKGSERKICLKSYHMIQDDDCYILAVLE